MHVSEDLTLARSLQCGGFQDQILQAVLWFSSGGTKSVLHHDGQDNINCVLDGSKDIILIDEVRIVQFDAKKQLKKWSVTEFIQFFLDGSEEII